MTTPPRATRPSGPPPPFGRRPRAAKARRGFTLTEMLVVVAIIALLAGLLVPVISGVMRTVVDASCQIRLRGMTTALHAYTMEQKCFPYIRHTTTRTGDKTSEYIVYWKDYIIFDNDAAVFGWTNLGLLWSPKADANPDVPEGKYIKDPDDFWCPIFNRKNEPFELGLGGCPWPPGKSPQGYWCKTKSTYSRRPACAGKYPGGIPDGAAVVADYFPRVWYYAQLPEHVHKNATGFYVGYYSGTVDWFEDTEGVALDPANFSGSTYMDSATRTEQSWQKLDYQDVPWPANAYLQ